MSNDNVTISFSVDCQREYDQERDRATTTSKLGDVSRARERCPRELLGAESVARIS